MLYEILVHHTFQTQPEESN